jgi:hypothetical protein
VTASSVASVKVEVKQLEQLARALGVPLPAPGSGASLFRSCLERAQQLVPVIESVDRIETRARARVLVLDAETDNAGVFEALRTFKRALGGTGDGQAKEEAERTTAPPSAC